MKRFSFVVLALLITGCGGRSTGELVNQLKAKDATDRLHAIHALGQRTDDAAAVVPALSEALKDRDPFIRRDAAQALAKIGPDARPALPALRPLLKDRHQGVRRAATEAMKKIDPSAVRAG